MDYLGNKLGIMERRKGTDMDGWKTEHTDVTQQPNPLFEGVQKDGRQEDGLILSNACPFVQNVDIYMNILPNTAAVNLL